MLDVLSLVESSNNVGNTMEKFLLARQRGDLEKSSTKKRKILEEIMTKPKNFFNLSMETLLNLSGLSKAELKEKIRLALKNLLSKACQNLIQNLVFETDDERILRGNSWIFFIIVISIIKDNRNQIQSPRRRQTKPVILISLFLELMKAFARLKPINE